MNNFWQKLKRPFFILAPMADVTDMAFRQIVVSCGKPDVMFTEFVSADGLCSEKGKPKLMPHLAFKENERPIVAQIFGSNPRHFYEAAKLITGLCPVVNFSDTQSVMLEATEKSTTGFDGIDINMGCPAGKIVKNDSGAGLILNPKLAKEIIKETKRGVAESRAGRESDLPVSIKTRIGYNKIITEEWVSHLIEAEPAVIIIHGRTQKEMSKVPAHWDEIAKAGVLCRQAGIPIIGNGDIMTYKEGLDKSEKCGLDGIMVGRGIFSNPWFFDPLADPTTKTPKERIELLKRHISLFTELWGNPPSALVGGGGKNFDLMKRFFRIYISNWEDAKELRIELMKTKTASEARNVINGWIT